MNETLEGTAGPTELAATPLDSCISSPEALQEMNRLDSRWLYPASVALSVLLLGLVSVAHPLAGVIGALGAGVLCLIRKRRFALLVAVGMLSAFFVTPVASASPGFWALMVLLLFAGLAPMRAAPSLLRVTPVTWAACLVLFAASICGLLIGNSVISGFFIVTGCLCSALLGAGLTRHLAMSDARLLAWGEEGLGAVTRDLLLGRITRGMLHDLSQPLNVISMANDNLGYITERLDTDAKTRQQLLDRVARISTHTDNAASILSLFRWFGRSAFQDEAGLSVRNALTRAVASTRSNVRYQGIELELKGNALDLLVTRQHGRLEMMAVAALLSAFGAFERSELENSKGQIIVLADAQSKHISIEILCADEQGQPVACKRLDNATLWLIEQMAREVKGDFRCLTHRSGNVQFAIRLEREDI